METDELFMQRCLDLASQGLGKVAPNPMVGAVVVHKGKVIGEGFHEVFGGPHAEVNAIDDTLRRHPPSILRESTLYVNLEPCAHHGKTPPCCDLLIKHALGRVVVGCSDPFEEVNGKGLRKMTEAGMNVTIGILEKECRELNRRFFTFHEKKRPYIILKYAQSRDRFISPVDPTPETRQISNPLSKKLVHKWRSEEPAILVGTMTALVDNPELTVRDWPGKNPLRLLIDRSLKVPSSSNLFNAASRTLVFNEKQSKANETIEWIQLDFQKPVLPEILDLLHKRSVQSLLVEGGRKVLQSFIDEGCWDEARIFTSPLLLKEGTPAPVFRKTDGEKFSLESDELLILRNAH